MRLIDADALYEVMEFNQTSVSVCMTVEEAKGRTAQKVQCLEDIDNAPTVDAIPVEFVRDMMLHGDPDESNAAWRVLKAWEEASE